MPERYDQSDPTIPEDRVERMERVVQAMEARIVDLEQALRFEKLKVADLYEANKNDFASINSLVLVLNDSVDALLTDGMKEFDARRARDADEVELKTLLGKITRDLGETMARLRVFEKDVNLRLEALLDKVLPNFQDAVVEIDRALTAPRTAKPSDGSNGSNGA